MGTIGSSTSIPEITVSDSKIKEDKTLYQLSKEEGLNWFSKGNFRN